eukprot:gene18126-biopygen1356
MAEVSRVGALPEGQHAYRPRHGTNTAVMHLIDGVTRILEEDRDCVVAAMDLSAAFDTVDHHILLEKLSRRVGLQGAALSLIRNYLQGRQQAVHGRAKRSPLLDIVTGVPQGSVLGPILFSLNVSDVVEDFNDITIVQYADDCTLLIPVQPGEDAGPVVRRQVQRFVDYCAANRI